MEMQRGDPGRAPRRKLGTQAAFPPGSEAHPPEDGRELHAAPELREVLEAHAVHLLEAAEQRLAVGLQARRDPHAFKRPRAHGTSRGVRRGPHVPSRLANSRNQVPRSRPSYVTQARSVTYYPRPQAPPPSGPFLAPAALVARA